MPNHDIVVAGPGAMGCGVAGVLKQRGADVALLDYKPGRAAQIRRQGVRFELEGRMQTVSVPAYAAAKDCGTAQLTIILVKAFDTAAASRHAAPCAADRAAVLTLQNGLGNYEAIAATVPEQQVLAGTIVMGCASEDIAQVRISGIGQIVIGSPFGNDGLAGGIRGLLGEYWPSTVTEERVIDRALWRKVTVNAAVNPLTALTGLRNGALVQDAMLRATLGDIVREAVLVAEAGGIDAFAAVDDAVDLVEDVCRLTAENRSSMLQDVSASKPTEIDQICGEIVRRGQRSDLSTPLCRAMTALIMGLRKARDHSQVANT